MPINSVATEYTFSMGCMSIFSNFAMTQKYASLAWDIIIEPAPIDRTHNSLLLGVTNPNAGNRGCMIDAAVIIATVEEPCAVFKMKVSRKGNSNPIPANGNASLKC